MKKKKSQTTVNSLRETPQKASSTFDHLLLRHKLPRDFPLEEKVKEFNVFWNKVGLAPLNLDESLETFAKEKNWTDDDRKNFRIMSAIKDGWAQVFDKTAKEHLIAKKDEEGEDWIYQYECRNCKSIRQRKLNPKLGVWVEIKERLAQTEYDHLEEDEAIQTLLGQKEIRKCPNCGEYAQFKKIRERTQSWEMEKLLRKNERIAKRESVKERPLTPEQLREYDKALDEYQDVIKRGEELIHGQIPTEKEIRDFRLYAKPYKQKCCEAIGAKLCARPDCLEILPPGSRRSRKYCSEECNAIEKSRRARKK